MREREKSSRRYCSNKGTAANESNLEIVPLPSGIHDERTAKSSKQQLEKHSVLLSFPKPELVVRILYKSTLFVLIMYWWLHNTECSGEMWN